MKKNEKIVEEVTEPIKIVNEKKDYFKIVKEWIIKNSHIIISVIIIFVALVIGGKIIKYFNSPEFIANKYFKAIANNNYEEIYNLIDVDDSKLVSKEILKEKINTLKVDAYKLENVQISEDNALVTYKYEYKNSVNYVSVLLRKSMKNKYLIFNNWKIESAKVANNITIKVPLNSKVLIDDINIKEFLSETTDDYDIYTIEEMISGEYKISIELENCLKTEDKIEVKSNSYFVVGNIELEDSIKEDVKSQLNNSLVALYNNAIENKIYSETGLTSLKNEYQYLKNILNNRGYSLTSINFSDIDVESATYDTMLKVTFSINCKYQITYNDTTLNGDVLTNITANFKEKDGKYILDSIDNLPINFILR